MQHKADVGRFLLVLVENNGMVCGGLHGHGYHPDHMHFTDASVCSLYK